MTEETRASRKEATTGAWIKSPRGRQYLYRAAIAILALVAVYLGISAEQQTLITNVIGAVLSVGSAGALAMADRNVP